MIQEPQTKTFKTTPGVLHLARLGRVGGMVALALALGTGAAGCGNLTAGGASDVSLEVASDEAATPAVGARSAASASPESSTGEAPPSGVFSPLEGTISVTFSLRLVDAEGQEVEVTDGTQSVTLDMEAGTRVEVARTSVPAGDYELVQVTFLAIGAEITDSPGQSQFPAEVEVDLSDGPLVVERPQALTLTPDDQVTLVLDLRSGTWLQAADPSDGRVARGIVQNAVRIVVEGSN